MKEQNQEHDRVIIFGGAFNPPTLAHQQIMANCLELSGYSEVWVMPSGDRHDKTMSSDDAERMAMLNLIKTKEFDNEPRIVISDFELNLPRPTETLVTLGALAIEHPDKEFWFVYGADSYNSMPTWPGGTELQSKISALVLARDGIELPPESDQVKHMPNIHETTALVSSTEVRAAVRQQANISGMVADSVRRFIMQRALYASAE